jgi:tetratricopeptide (TPR) repeat protein
MRSPRIFLIASIRVLLILPVATIDLTGWQVLVLAQTQNANQYTGVAKQVDEVAQQITVLINSKSNGNGSGVIVARNENTYYVLTAAHVIQNPDTYSLVAPDGQQYQIDANETKILAGVDLAVVKFTSTHTYSLATLGRYNLKKSFVVFVCGFPKKTQGEQPQRLLTAGLVAQEDEADFATKDSYSLGQGGRGLVYTSLSYPGMSGGAVLDSRGYVVGINTAAENELELNQAGQPVEISLGASLGVPIDTFVSLAQKASINPQSLQLETNAPPDLSESQVKSIQESFLDAIPSQEASAFDWLNYGNRLWRFGRYDEAVAAFEKAIALQDNFYQAYYSKGLALWYANKYPEALAAFESATQLTPSFSTAWRWQGLTLINLKKYDSALVAYDKAIELQSDDFVFYVERGYVLRELKRFAQAVTAYSKAIQLKPHAWTYNNRGIAYADLKQYQLAIDDYNQSLAINPDYDLAYNNRGAAYAGLKQYQLAIDDFNNAIAIDSNNADAYNNRGLAYAYLEQYQKAIDDFNSTIAINSNNAEAYNNRGLTYAYLEQYQLAINDFNSAIAIAPNFTSAYNNRSLAYLNQQQYQLAIEDCNKAIALKRDFAEAYYNRSLVYYELEERERAIADLERATQLCQQGNSNCQQIQEVLRQIQTGEI